MPLAGGEPTALRVAGGPIDQFSFLEESGFLNVLVRAGSAGDAMWSPEFTQGNLALLRVPLDQFSTALPPVTSVHFKSLPKPTEEGSIQNRYVGGYLLYGSGNPWGYPWKARQGQLYVFRYVGNDAAEVLDLDHSVDRIEPLGDNALVVGSSDKNLVLTSVALGPKPRVVSDYIEANAAQGELRSHGFFYKPRDLNSGLLGLPVREGGKPGFEHLFYGSNSILFLRNERLQLKKIGSLSAKWLPPKGVDQCHASCMDWYGNSRPIFLQNRIFALLGYELVEGVLGGGNLHDANRVNLLTPLKFDLRERNESLSKN
jgi:hypothetical protein